VCTEVACIWACGPYYREVFRFSGPTQVRRSCYSVHPYSSQAAATEWAHASGPPPVGHCHAMSIADVRAKEATPIGPLARAPFTVRLPYWASKLIVKAIDPFPLCAPAKPGASGCSTGAAVKTIALRFHLRFGVRSRDGFPPRFRGDLASSGPSEIFF
jgi:hypothetical protein